MSEGATFVEKKYKWGSLFVNEKIKALEITTPNTRCVLSISFETIAEIECRDDGCYVHVYLMGQTRKIKGCESYEEIKSQLNGLIQ